MSSRVLLLSLVLASACHRDPFRALDVNEEVAAPGLEGDARVVWTGSGVPHVYGSDRVAVAWASGFVVARDRFFTMDLVRRVGLGRTSELLGDPGLEADMEARGYASAYVADRILDHATDEQRAMWQAFCDGVNTWLDAAKDGDEDVPPEYELLSGLLGADEPADLMAPFAPRDVAGIAATLTYQTSFENGDVGREREMARVAEANPFVGAPLEDARRAGFYGDVLDDVAPIVPVASSYGWGLDGTLPDERAARRAPRQHAAPAPGVGVPDEVLARLDARLARLDARLDHSRDVPWGSNAWAVAGSVTDDGRGLLAGDGHLGLEIPPLFYRIGFDTAALGDGALTQVGVVPIGMPSLAGVGTNGKVAWSQTQFSGDITDWYAEQLQLDAAGAPMASRFQGAWEPLVKATESYEVRDVPFLDSVGRTETWSRWTTFDGRWITAIEGRPVSADEAVGEGETKVALLGDYVVPGDIDGDGVISAVSFDWVGLDTGNLFHAVDRLGQVDDVVAFYDEMRGLASYSQNLAVADSQGHILYSGYQPVPCRDYLPRDGERRWVAGADPRRLLDGTTYGGFEVRFDADWKVIEGDADPYRCVVPHADFPHAIDPDRGYVATANNDPGAITLDGSIYDDPYYLGDGWNDAFRAARIGERIEQAIDAGGPTLATMQSIQADHTSPLGRHYGPHLVDALRVAQGLSATDGPKEPHEARIVALFDADPEAYGEVADRLEAWIEADCPAESGVDTFYHQAEEVEREHAAATMIFNAWFRRFRQQVLDDEGFPGGWERRGPEKLLSRMLRSRGVNGLGLACYVEDTSECAYFDVLSTEPVERMEEVALASLADTLAFLRANPSGPGEGGFGTDDMAAWLWGLRHQAKFESLVANELGGGPLGALLADFEVTTARLPLAEGLPFGDPRRDLKWFPRPGDWESVDAANPSGGGLTFTHGSGPVFRMVFALGPDGVEGYNVLPGGQSGDPNSDHYDDQMGLWLANEAEREWFTVDEVVEHAERYAVFVAE